jgi:hypothetical protein
MAYAAELAGAGAPARFIYVWPTRELIDRSWSWPTSWHEAFQEAASRIGLAVAIYVLDGRRFTKRLISLQLSVGSIAFRVERRGTSLFITVSEFTGPEAPGPDAPDGTHQPCPIEGLALGLLGSGKNAYLVVFHGPPRFLPATRGCVRGRSHPAPGGGCVKMETPRRDTDISWSRLKLIEGVPPDGPVRSEPYPHSDRLNLRPSAVGLSERKHLLGKKRPIIEIFAGSAPAANGSMEPCTESRPFSDLEISLGEACGTHSDMKVDAG